MFKYDTSNEDDLNSEFNIDTALNNNWDKIDSKIKKLDNNKVDKVTGKVLSSNDFTNEKNTKLDGIATGAQVNVIEQIKVNGVEQPIGTDKSVNIEMTTGGGTVEIQRYRTTLSAGTIIVDEYGVILPISYIVGNNSLAVYWNGQKLIKATATEDGHYNEVGEDGASSTVITFHRTASDGSYTLPEDVVLEAVVTGTLEIISASEEEGG